MSKKRLVTLILSIGIMSIISGAFFEFLNVTGPAIDI